MAMWTIRNGAHAFSAGRFQTNNDPPQQHIMSSERARVLLRHVQASKADARADEERAGYETALRKVAAELRVFIEERNCHPIMLRLAWHDAGTYDRTIACFPDCGGANGSIRLEQELAHDANAGLDKAVRFLRPFHTKYPVLSWADLIQLAGALAVELAGGPRIPMRYGRFDAVTPAPDGRLPAASPTSPVDHVREVNPFLVSVCVCVCVCV